MNHPYINASLSADGSQIELHNYVNLAMAVGMDEAFWCLSFMGQRSLAS